MKLFLDTEFIEDGRTIELLSIGVVRDDGVEYYAEPAETDRSRADEWVTANVLPHLTGPVKPRAQIAAELIEFAGEDPEWWAYFADYDWVVLCQLFGRMIDLPSGWPMFCMDLKQWAVQNGVLDLHRLAKIDGPEHNALADARWAARAHAALRRRGGSLMTAVGYVWAYEDHGVWNVYPPHPTVQAAERWWVFEAFVDDPGLARQLRLHALTPVETDPHPCPDMSCPHCLCTQTTECCYCDGTRTPLEDS